MATPDNEPKRSKPTLWILLLVASVILNIYQWRNNSTTINTFESRVDTLVVERVNIEKELSEARTELNKYQGISSNLDSLLKDANAQLTDYEKKVKEISRTAKNSAELNRKMKEQLANLQGLRDEYLTRIDSLLTTNRQLREEKQQLTGTVETLSKNLETTISTASVLKAEYFKVNTFQRRSGGKYKPSSLAKRTHKMEVCFDILGNSIAKQGDREVYLKITEPGGKVIGSRAEGSSTAQLAGGEETLYTTNTSLSYSGTKQNVCIPYEEQADKMFPSGTYLIEVYVDGHLAGASSYVLR
jgi:hypothetical protein